MKGIEAVLVSSLDLEDAIKIGSSSSPSLYSFNGCLINRILILKSNPERLEFVLYNMASRIPRTNLECLEVVLLSSLDLEDALIDRFFGLFTPHAHWLALQAS
jgi:hypothetical protein